LKSDKRRRADDHLCLVAGISKIQINELRQRGITTMKALASMALPLDWNPHRGSIDAYSRVCEQARLQVGERESGGRKLLVLPVEPGFGLTRLPEPSAGDVFLTLKVIPSSASTGSNIYSAISLMMCMIVQSTEVIGPSPERTKNAPSKTSSISS
jgi:predicted RecB family nuclease